MINLIDASCFTKIFIAAGLVFLCFLLYMLLFAIGQTWNRLRDKFEACMDKYLKEASRGEG